MNKPLLYVYNYFSVIFLLFCLCFYHIIFFELSIKFPQQNINQSITVFSRIEAAASICFLYFLVRFLCVWVYTLPPVGFFRLRDIRDIREKFGSTIFCCEYFWVLLPSSFISISESILFHLQRRKLQPTAHWRENDMI